MRKILILFLITISSFAQKKEIVTQDTTGNVFIMFVRDDSVAVIYQGKQTAFTADGVYAYDLSAFDMKVKGFMRYNGLKNSIEEAKNDNCKDDEIEKPIDPPTDEHTVAFPNPKNYGNSRYIIEPTDWLKVSVNKGKIHGMNGFDFAPIQMNQGSSIYEYKEWNQGYVAIKGRNAWRNGDKTYFLRPKGYTTDIQTNLMDFDIKFPDFSLPKGKIVVMQPAPIRERNVNNYLKKGVSFAKDAEGKDGYRFVADDWLTDLGCPTAYVTTQKEMDKWCAEVDADELLKSFIDKIYYPNKDFGYVMLNWEAVGYRWNVRKDKLIRCLEYWATHEHTAKLGLWTVSGISMGRPIFQGLGLDFTELLTFDGDLASFQTKYNKYVSVDFSYAKYADVGHIGGYQNYPTEEGVIHHYLFELLLHKKYNPNKPVLATIWFDHEPIDNFNLERIRVDGEDGIYFAQVKPKVTPSTAFNWGVWSMIGYGFDCWSDPNYWTEDKRYWGWGAKDSQGNDLPNHFGEFYTKYSAQPMKNIDWMMSGVWAMSENKDIIETAGDWQFITLPTKSFYDKSVMIAYKVKGNEALVLALDGFGRVDGETKHQFSISGKEYEVSTFGRFTSVVRLKL
jgi:hypothetical protein